MEKIITKYYTPITKLGIDLTLGIGHGYYTEKTKQPTDGYANISMMLLVPVATAFVPANILETKYQIKINPLLTQVLAGIGPTFFLIGNQIGRAIATYT